MDEAYSGYEYKRYRKPFFKGRFYLFVILPIGLALLFFSTNLVFGFVSFGHSKNTGVVCPRLTFYVTQSQPFTDKTDALHMAMQTRQQGGSAYLIANGTSWTVVQDICHQKREGTVRYSSKRATITLSNQSDYKTVTSLTSTFISTFEILCDFAKKFESKEMSRQEISDQSRSAYNNLLDLVLDFEKIQLDAKNPQYTILLTYLTRQLFGLSLIWLDGNAENFTHILKNAKSWIAFAYFDACYELNGLTKTNMK